MKQICVGNLTIIGSKNGLSPGRCQAIIWINAGILLIGPLGTNFIGIQTFSFKKMHLKMSSADWRSFCLGLNVLSANLTGQLRTAWPFLIPARIERPWLWLVYAPRSPIPIRHLAPGPFRKHIRSNNHIPNRKFEELCQSWKRYWFYWTIEAEWHIYAICVSILSYHWFR